MVMQKQFNIERYCILAIGQKDEHAEMRMLGFLLNQEKILTPSEIQKSKLIMEAPIYIGISKLSCPYCNATLNVFNTLLHSTNETVITTSQNLQGILPQIGDEDQDDDEVISSENLSEKAVSVLIQMSHESTLDSTLEVRGSHDLRFKWTFPAFARDIDETQKWNCQKVKKVKDVSADRSKVKSGTVCYEDTKKDMRCAIVLDTSISKEGRKNVFNVSPCVIEFSLAKDKVADNTVNAESLANACRSYYCPGYKSQLLSVSILPGEEKIIEVWIDLEAKLSEKANLSCLQSAQFNKKLLVAYETVNKRVVDVSVPIKMVPSASTSSAEELGLAKLDIIGERLNQAPELVIPEESEESGDDHHAEESIGSLSRASSDNSESLPPNMGDPYSNSDEERKYGGV